MKHQEAKFKIKGRLKIYSVSSDNQRVLLVDKNNAILPNASDIVAKLLANYTWPISHIWAYKANNPLASASVTYDPGVPAGQAVFRARFIENSFNDVFDELRLASANGGDFSQITGLSVLKDNTLQLEVEWHITVILI
jgi:hypothetical protein